MPLTECRPDPTPSIPAPLRAQPTGLLAAMLLPLIAALAFASAASAQVQPPNPPPSFPPHVGGVWGPIIEWPHVPVSMANLPDGRILTFASNEPNAFPGSVNDEFTYAAVWDHVTGEIVEVPHPSHDMFCAALVTLEDGRTFIIGGRNKGQSPWVSYYDFVRDTWVQLDASNNMNRGRWYPTAVAMGDGSVFIAVGDGGGVFPEVWTEDTGWTLLTGVDLSDTMLASGLRDGGGMWPMLQLDMDGTVLHHGAVSGLGMNSIDPFGGADGLGSITKRPHSYPAFPDEGVSVVYDEGKILVAGGSTSTSSSTAIDLAWTIDLEAPSLQATPVSSMNWPRQFQNEVLLPNGDVLVVGGNTSGQKFTDAFAILNAEAWDPDTDTWTLYNAQNQARTYHSTALLLLDGSVISAGGGLSNRPCPAPGTAPPGECGSDHWNAEVFYPPYLYQADGELAPRPVIDSAPGVVRLARTFQVSATPGLSAFSMVRMSSTTHTMNTDQRFLRPTMNEVSPGTYELTLHTNENVLVPGYWMLFAMDGEVPSVAEVIQVTNDGLPRGKPIERLGHDVGATVFVQIQAEDPDGNPIVFAQTNLPPGLSLDPQSGQITGQPTTPGVYDVTISAFDGTEASNIEFSWIVSTARSEFGTLTVDQVDGDEWHSVTLSRVIQNPVVVMGPPSRNDPAPTTVRVGNVTPTGFEFQIDEWDYLDGAHGLETISYLVVEAGEYVLPDGSTLVAGVSTGIDHDNPWTEPFAPGLFDTTPLVLAQIVDNSSGIAAVPRIEGVSDAGFTVRIQKEENLGQTFPDENVHWIAVEPTQISGLAEAASTGTVVDEVPETVAFSEGLSGLPVLLAGMQTRNGADVAALRVEAVTTAGFDVIVEEEQSQDSEVAHADEEVGWLAIDPSNAALGLQAFYNTPPTVLDPGDQVGAVATSVSMFIQAGDAEGDDLDFSAIGLPPGLSIDSNTGEIYGSITTAGVFAVTVTVTDESVESDSVDFLWTVEDAFQLIPFASPPELDGTSVSFTASVNLSGTFEYTWNFGDGTPTVGPLATPDVTHVFAGPGRHTVTVTAIDPTTLAQTSMQFVQNIAGTPTAAAPTASSSIVYDEATDRVWVVNPDNDSVSVIDAPLGLKLLEIPVCDEPVTLDVAANGDVWVACRGDDVIDVIDPVALAVEPASRIELGAGAGLYAIVFDPSGANAFVSLGDLGEVRRLDGATGAELGAQSVGPHVRHLGVTSDGATVHATYHITPLLTGESTGVPSAAPSEGASVLSLDAATLAIGPSITLGVSTIPDTEHSGRGVPNYVGAPIVSPDGTEMLVPSKQDNVYRGQFREGVALTHDSMVRAITSRIDLTTGQEDILARRDHDDESIAHSTIYSRLGAYAFTSLEGTRAVSVLEPFSQIELGRVDVGRAPHGLALSPDGLTLYVDNFMDRTVTVLDLTNLLDFDDPALPVLATILKVDVDTLSIEILNGKQLFYDSRDPRLALAGYIACASCHRDGGHDGRVWDFSDLGEGFRNTISLEGRGQGHGPVHWTANFDEVQDFENQIRHFEGLGLMNDPDFAATSDPLGTPKAGLSIDLDDLAAYVGSLASVGSSPARSATGALTADGAAGRLLFQSEQCGDCHLGSAFTDSVLLRMHDVGTLKAISGPQTALDTPTLRGLWATAPYLHDGSAATIADAVAAHTGVALSAGDLALLASYLEQIDDAESSAPSSALLVESFDDGDYDGWTISDPGDRDAPSDWQVVGGVMTQNTNILSNPTTVESLTKIGTYAIYDGGYGWTDYRVRLEIGSLDNDDIGFMFRVQGLDDYYRFSWNAQMNYQRLVKNVGGSFTLLGEVNTAYTPGQTYVLEVVVEGPSIEISVDGLTVFSVTDPDITGGTIGLSSWANEGAQFSAIAVEPLADEPPTITSTPSLAAEEDQAYAYDADATLEASGTGPITFSLESGPAGMTVSSVGGVTWTPTAGQVGSQPVVLRADNLVGSDTQSFTIEVAAAPPPAPPVFTSTPSTSATVGAPYVYDGDGQAAASGPGPITFSLVSGPAGLTVDPDGAVSWTPGDGQEGLQSVEIEALNAFGAATQSFGIDVAERPPYLLSDDFADGDLAGWIIEDPGDREAPSDWQVVGGVLTQGTNILSNPTTVEALSKIGTYAIHDGGAAWDDYRVSVLIGSDDDDEVGLIFRMQGLDDYYRFSWNTQMGYQRLVKNVAGNFTLLGEINTTYTIGQMYLLEVVLDGASIEVSIDGAPVFSVVDPDLTAGTIALSSWANAGARFDDVLVEPLAPQPPLITSTPSLVGEEDQAYAYDADSTLEAAGTGPFTFSLVSGPSGMTVSPTGQVAWTPTAGQTGLQPVEVRADNAVGFDTQSFMIDVAAAPPPAPPVFTSAASTNATVGAAYAYDADGQAEASGPGPITFSLVSGPTGFVVDPDGTVTWTPAADQEGVQSVEIEAANSFGSVTQSFDVDVAAAPPYMLSADFETGDLAGWTIADPGDREAPSDWQVVGGVLTQGTNILSNPTTVEALSKIGTYAIYDGGTAWDDYKVSMLIGSDDDDEVGLIFRMQGLDDYYRFSWNTQMGYQRLVKNVGGNFTLLGETNTTYTIGQLYLLEVVLDGASIDVSIDGVPVFSVVDPDLTSGTIALSSWANAGGLYDEVLVEPLAPQPPLITSTPSLVGEEGQAYAYDADSTVEAAGTGPFTFSLVSGPSGMTVSPTGQVAWTPTAGQTGLQPVEVRADNAVGFDTQSFTIDVAAAPPPSPPVFTSTAATDATVDAPYAYDANDQAEASGPGPITFALVSGPAGFAVAPNGTVSWTPTAGQEGVQSVEIEASNTFGTVTQSFDVDVAPAPPYLLSDDFEDGDHAGWTIEDPGDREAPSDWQVVGGVLNQGTNILSNPTTVESITKIGTYAIYDGGTTWDDYRVSVLIGSDDNDEIGVMFRMQGLDDYYRFSWNTQMGYQRLVKNVGGNFTLLGEISTTYTTGQMYLLEVVLDGPSIEVSIDGVPVFSVVDPDLTGGTIGLSSWANAGALFDDVLVEPLAPQAPLITSVPSLAGEEDQPYAYDADGIIEAAGTGPFTFALDSGPSGMTVSSAGVVSWTPTAGQIGPQAVVVRADNAVGSDTQSFTVEVAAAPPPAPPVFTSTAATTATVGAAYAYDADGVAEASGPGPITFSLVSGPLGFAVAPGGAVTWTPVAGQEGVHAVEIEAANAFGTVAQSFDVDVAPAPPYLLSDDFEDGDLAGWTVSDPGDREAPSDWQVVGGVLMQNTNILSNPTTVQSITKIGSYAIFDGGTTWDDYKVSMLIGSDDNDEIGLMFRVQGLDDYYRFSWNTQMNYQRLVKNVGGSFSLLGEVNTTYTIGQMYLLEVVVDGPSIEVSIDGGVVFSVVDPDLAGGTIGLSTWANAGGRYDDVLVEPLAP